MTQTRFRWVLGLAVAFGALAFGADDAHAQRGSITGRVTDKETGSALQGVRLQIIGEQLFAISGPDGRYTIREVGAGAKQVRSIFVGYGDTRASVTVTASETATLDFQLAAVPFSLDEIISTATGDQRRVELGHTVGTIKSDSLVATAAIPNVGSLIQGRVAGVTVLPSSGTTGTGTRIRIRGNASVSLSNEPILFIDGVRASNAQSASTLGVGGQSPSRLNDLNPEEIESIEIIKGPSASTLYGPEAGNGVIRVTTKKGLQGKPRWNFYTEGGTLEDPLRYPDNYANFGRLATNGVPNYAPGAQPAGTGGNNGFFTCINQNFATGICATDTVTTFNVLNNPETRPINTGWRQQYGANITGGNDNLQYFVSGEYEGETGTAFMPQQEQDRLLTSRGLSRLEPYQIRPNTLKKISLRSNVKAKVGTNMDVQASIGYISSDLRLPQNDNNVLGLLSSGYLGQGFAPATSTPTILGVPISVFGVDTFGLGGWGFFRPGEVMSQQNIQNVERYTAVLNYNWQAFSWLTLRSNVGYDITQRVDEAFNPRGEGPAFGTIQLGQRTDNRVQVREYTADFGGTFNFSLTDALTSRTTFGVQYFRTNFNSNGAFGQDFAVGQRTINGALTQSASETTQERATLGQFVEQTFGFNDRLFVNAALRRDDASAVGANFDPKILPRVGASWVLSDEPFFPKSRTISSLRLRGAWGQSTVLPGTLDPLLFFAPVLTAVGEPGITFSSIGNPGLKPETSTEYEFGLESALFNDRVTIELTRYDKTTRDALISRPLPPSVGAVTNQFFNIGSVNNNGWELGLNVRAIDSKSFTWDVGFSGSTLDNKVIQLGPEAECRIQNVSSTPGCSVAPIIFNSNIQRAAPGYPLGGYFDRRIERVGSVERTFLGQTVNVVPADSIFVSDSIVFLRNLLPSRNLDINTSVGLFNGRVRIAGLMSYQGGYGIMNLTDRFRCATQSNCQGLLDPRASVAEQGRVVATRTASVRGGPAAGGQTVGQTFDGFIEDASFWRLREVSVTYNAPESVARTFGGRSLAVTFAGRNLALFTDFTGVDPEQNEGNANLGTRTFLAQPQVRTLLARVQVGF